MTHTPTWILALVLMIAAAPRAAAESAAAVGAPRIRTTDARLQRLVRDGARASATFRHLVERLHRSDVVVYLECSGRPGSDARLAFVSAVGGYRYLHIRVAYMPSWPRQIALIGHELQHAVEIADAPAIVDARSLAREYERIGFVRAPPANAEAIAFDSAAAVQAGHRVLREISRREDRRSAAHRGLEDTAY